MSTKILRKFFFLLLCVVDCTLFAKPQYILCVEGGGSKTTLHVLDRKGQLLDLEKNNEVYKKIETTGSNINIVGREGVKAVFKNIFLDVKLHKDSIDLSDILTNCHVVTGMAGLGLPKNKQSVIDLLEEFGIPNDNIVVLPDAELALKLIDNQGLILISGTGSICFGKNNSSLFRVGGLGRILGDEGSGYQIGLDAIKAGVSEEYGWGMPTRLTALLKEFFQVEELKNLIPKINLCEMLPSKIASCASLVFNEADTDIVAKKIIDKAANDLAKLLITQLKISHLSNCELHLWGGIFKNVKVNDFIHQVMEIVNGHENRNLKIINHAHDNVAVLYAEKFLLNDD